MLFSLKLCYHLIRSIIDYSLLICLCMICGCFKASNGMVFWNCCKDGIKICNSKNFCPIIKIALCLKITQQLKYSLTVTRGELFDTSNYCATSRRSTKCTIQHQTRRHESLCNNSFVNHRDGLDLRLRESPFDSGWGSQATARGPPQLARVQHNRGGRVPAQCLTTSVSQENFWGSYGAF